VSALPARLICLTGSGGSAAGHPAPHVPDLIRRITVDPLAIAQMQKHVPDDLRGRRRRYASACSSRHKLILPAHQITLYTDDGERSTLRGSERADPKTLAGYRARPHIADARGLCFSLMIFSYGEQGSLFYISSAQRDDMIKTMREFIQKQGML
jgi:hypothetical protein